MGNHHRCGHALPGGTVFTTRQVAATRKEQPMMNDHAWMQLHAHRESEHRARARRRGGDDTPGGSARTSPAQRLRLRLSALFVSPAATVRSAPAPAAASPPVVVTAVPAGRAAARRTASDAPTTAALAWARLASGAGTLEPASPTTAELERDAA